MTSIYGSGYVADMTDRLPLPQPLPRPDGWTIPGVYTADQMRQYADDANAALRETNTSLCRKSNGYVIENARLAEQVRVLRAALTRSVLALAFASETFPAMLDDYNAASGALEAK